jgi:hypothetical protein
MQSYDNVELADAVAMLTTTLPGTMSQLKSGDKDMRDAFDS